MSTAKPHEAREQGVTSASLQFTLPVAHCVRAQGSRVGQSGCPGGRNHCVSTRLNSAELSALQSDAKVSHKRLGALLREAYFYTQGPHVPAVNAEAWDRLADTLDELQNVTLLVNSGQLPENLLPALSATLDGVNALREALIGKEGAEYEG